MNDTADRRAGLLVAGSGIAVSLLLLIPAIGTGFLSDDFLDFEHGFSPEAFTRFEAGGFRPLTVMLWVLDARLWGPARPQGWHVTCILLHLANVILISRLVFTHTRDFTGSLAGTMLFAVSWAVIPSAGRVSGRPGMLAMAFMLGALLLHSESIIRRSWRRRIVAAALFLCSLLSKETMLLSAPLFGLQAAVLGDERKPIRTFLGHSALYSLPVALYLVWRLAWLGTQLGYAESTSFGLLMMRNLVTLARMPFSPWLDGLPVRIVLVGSAVMLAFIAKPWRRKLFLTGLFVLPASTVLNLPPRPDSAYALLPAASEGEERRQSRPRATLGAPAQCANAAPMRRATSSFSSSGTTPRTS